MAFSCPKFQDIPTRLFIKIYCLPASYHSLIHRLPVVCLDRFHIKQISKSRYLYTLWRQRICRILQKNALEYRMQNFHLTSVLSWQNKIRSNTYIWGYFKALRVFFHPRASAHRSAHEQIYGLSGCVCRSYVVALVCPDRAALTRLATKLGKTATIEDLVSDRYGT